MAFIVLGFVTKVNCSELFEHLYILLSGPTAFGVVCLAIFLFYYRVLRSCLSCYFTSLIFY
jgi:hypothetical protein